MNRILVIDDEEIIRMSLARLLGREGYAVDTAGSLEEARAALAARSYALALCDLRLPDGEGTGLLGDAGEMPVVIMTSYASVRSAVDAMKQGAVDYIAKPFDHDEVLLLVARNLKQRRLEEENARLRSDLEATWPAGGMVGESAAMQRVFDWVQRLADTDATVLIRGESGTGKELVARAIHERSARRERAIVAVNCAAIPETLIEAELFGHEKGAFTGAVSQRQGLIEAADGGTLFLDEIGELTPAAQSRLLRVLQEGEIRRVGATGERHVDIRLVAATHRDLEAMVREGSFREDLYYRLKVVQLELPPLRERPEDLEPLTAYLLDRIGRRLRRAPPALSPAAREAIARHRWPGNVRELENALERAVILADGAITPEHLGLNPAAAPEPGEADMPDLSLDDYFRRFVLENQGQMTETELARRLGISRKALWERRQRMGIPRQRGQADPS
ncbi:MAG: sigma-54 dependent transcriptional regulator [Gammaproteobacteria bacterium]|nr:sigma-54 dependent transcriptional regulator [Gammaproteobacteria bacterium]MDX5375250.1 sigma-54 dependent transcriptional regulator [Gammaproteobacteria bacterium]